MRNCVEQADQILVTLPSGVRVRPTILRPLAGMSRALARGQEVQMKWFKMMSAGVLMTLL